MDFDGFSSWDTDRFWFPFKTVSFLGNFHFFTFVSTFREESDFVTFLVVFVSIDIMTFFNTFTSVILWSGITYTPTNGTGFFGFSTFSLSITITIGVTSVMSFFVIPFIVGITFVVTRWMFFTETFLVKIFNSQIRDTPSFIISMLIDGRPEGKFKIIIIVINDFFDFVEVIFPSRSTFVTNIGFLPLGSLDIEDLSISSTYEHFVIPRSNGVESEGDFDFVMIW